MFNLKKAIKARKSIVPRWEMKREIEAELQHHLELLIEENLASGMSPAEARQSALRRFGNLKDVNEVCVEIRTSEGVLWLEDLSAVLKSGGEKPWFTFLSVLTLSLGIGAAIAVFSIINNILWQPIFNDSSDKIVVVQETNSSGDEIDTSNLNFLDLRAQNYSLAYVAVFSAGTITVAHDSQSIRSNVSWISDDFFAVLATEPFLGRALIREDQQPTSNPAIVVSYRFWQHQLGSDRNLGDQKIIVDGRDYSVVGVVAPAINFSTETDIWIPRGLFEDDSARSAHNLKIIARLKNEFTLTQAQTDLHSIQRRLAEQYPDSNAEFSVKVIPLQEHLTAAVRPLLLTFLICVGPVLCIACANVTNLLLIRDESRQKQAASQISLGASRARIFRRIIVECLSLSLLSAFFGILLSTPIASVLLDFTADAVPEIKEIKIDGLVLIFTGGLSIIVGLMCGLMPALKLSQSDSADASAERETGKRGQSSGLSSLLVTAELALTVILLVSAGLLIQNFRHLSGTNPGFDPEHVLTAQLSLPFGNYQKEQDRINFYRSVLGKIKSIPLVESAGLINSLPLSGESINGTFYAEENPAQRNYAGFRITSPEYFQSLSIPLVKGRFFAEDDDENSTPVAIVSENLAKRLYPRGNPLGQRIKFPGMDLQNDTWMVIVGVVGGVKQISLDLPSQPEIYVPYSQRPYRARDMSIVIKTSRYSDALMADVRSEVKLKDANLPVKFETMNGILSKSFASHLHQTLSLTLFAFFALVLSVIGFYIVIKYALTDRVESAGKSRARHQRELINYSVKKGFGLAAMSIIIGLGGFIIISYSTPKMLFGLIKIEPIIFAATSIFMLALTFIISYLTARSSHRQAPH